MTSKVEKFVYNGFMVQPKKGYARYKAVSLDHWTNDPGIGLFNCSDGKQRLIPSCCLENSFVDSLEPEPELDPFKGIGVFFGMPSHS